MMRREKQLQKEQNGIPGQGLTRPFTALVCSGGGALGAYQVGVLKYIHEVFCRGKQSPFDIFTGFSCGALNATFYAAESFQAYDSRTRLEKLWESFHVTDYHENIFNVLRKSFFRHILRKRSKRKTRWSILDPKPMQDIISLGFNRDHLDRSLRLRTTAGMAIAASDLTTHRPTWFVEGRQAEAWDDYHGESVVSRISPAHVQASCSIPLYFPPVQIDGRYFEDGAFNLKRPLRAAIQMGATRILTISTKPLNNHNFMASEIEQIRIHNRVASQPLDVLRISPSINLKSISTSSL